MKRVYVSVSNDLGYTHNFPNATFSITPVGSVEVWSDEALIGFFPGVIAVWTEDEGDGE